MLYSACIIALLALLLPTAIQAQSQVNTKAADVPATNGGVDAGDTLKLEQRRLVLERAYSLSDLFLKFNDEGVKALSLAGLGDIIWKDNEPFARKMFLKALDISKPAQLKRQRSNIIMLLAKHDYAMSKEVIDQDFASKAAGRDFATLNAEISRDLVADDPQQSIEFAKRSLNGGVSPALIDGVRRLRRKDPAAADRLFLAMLSKIPADPAMFPEAFMYLGTYLFTSPKLGPDDPGSIQMGVGPVMVSDLTADRPDIPASLFRAYLQTTLILLSRPIQDQRQRNLYYALGRMLLPKTARFAPELSDTMANALQAIAGEIPPALTQESSYAELYRTTPRDREASLTDVEKNPSAKYRDASYLTWIYGMCRKGEFTRARQLNEKISDHDLQAQLSVLINFTEGARLTEQDQAALVAAKAIAQKLPQGIERAILFLGIARKTFVMGDNQSGVGAINEAVKTADNIYEARKPFLLLNAAGQLAPVEPLRAQQLLKEAVKAFNSQDQKLLFKVEWTERVDSPPVWRHFPLDVNGVEYTFKQNLALIFRVDPGYTIDTMYSLSDERLRADALLAPINAALR